MNTEEKKVMGKAYLEGKNGVSKNVGKACEYFLMAAEDGDLESMEYYAAYSQSRDAEKILKILDKYGWQNKCAGLYIQSMTAKGEFGNAVQEKILHLWENCRTCRDVLAFGDYLDACGYKDKEYIKRIYSVAMVLASLNEREELRDRLAKYGLQKDIVDGQAYREALKRRMCYGQNTQTVKKTVSREMADVLIEEKKGKLGKAEREIVNSVQPEVISEYQLVFAYEAYVGNFTYSFIHQESSSVTKHSGSGEISLNKSYASYNSNFIYDGNLNEFFNAAELDDKIPDGRINVGLDAIEFSDTYLKLLEGISAAEEYAVKSELQRTYSWSRSAIDVRITDQDKKNADMMYLVPFYFYIYRKDGKTVTLRVNGNDGEVDVFKDNPFALIEKGKKKNPKKTKSAKKFSFGIFLLLTLFTGVGGLLYAIYCAVKK